MHNGKINTMSSSFFSKEIWNNDIFLPKVSLCSQTRAKCLFYKVKELFVTSLHNLPTLALIKRNTCIHYFNITHELTCCWQINFINSLIKRILINNTSSTSVVLLYICTYLHTTEFWNKKWPEGFDVNLRKKVMLVANRNMKTVSDQAKSPFCLW